MSRLGTLSIQDRNRLLREAARLESLTQLNEGLVPELGRLLHASFVFAYRGVPAEQTIRAYLPPSTPDLISDYFNEYVAECPLHKVKDRIAGEVVPTTALYGHRRLSRTRVYNELWRPWGFDHHVALRFDRPEDGPEFAALGIMVNRDVKRGEYTPAELRWLRSFAPALGNALRRAARYDDLQDKLQTLEGLLRVRSAGTTQLVLGPRDQIVHAEVRPGDEEAVQLLRDPQHPVRGAARALFTGGDQELLVLEHHLRAGNDERAWQVGLQISELPAEGHRWVLISLRPSSRSPQAGLTPAEEGVLQALKDGLNNVEIGRRLFISPETVRTHLTRIYKKLGVRSRLEAVLKAQGTRSGRVLDSGP